MAKPKSASKTVGPFSRDRVLAGMDKRTRTGRIYRTIIADLIDHVGGNPSAAERLIIQSAALKATRLSLLSEKMLSGIDNPESMDQHSLGWANSLRLDLGVLGLDKRIKDVTPKLKDIIAASKAKGDDQ